MRLLLHVEDTFLIERRGLIIAPDLPLPTRFTNFTDVVMVHPPDSAEFQATASFSVMHTSPGGVKLVLLFHNMPKESIPIGSAIHASEAAHARLLVADA